MGTRPESSLITSSVIPASFGVHGPGESTMRAGLICTTPASDFDIDFTIGVIGEVIPGEESEHRIAVKVAEVRRGGPPVGPVSERCRVNDFR